MVIGYGEQKKLNSTAASASITGKELATVSNISVGSTLQGKMTGMSIISSSGFPGSEASINIRGVGTFAGGDTSPLLVVDGQPVSGNIESLNPQDIENITVMKDAASAAIYGSRAATG